MYCKHCGRQIDDKAVICTSCGTSTAGSHTSGADAPSFGFALLGFFIPIAGLILYIIYENQKPLAAKSAGKGALIGFIVSIVLSVLFFVFYFIFVFSMAAYTINSTVDTLQIIKSFIL